MNTINDALDIKLFEYDVLFVDNPTLRLHFALPLHLNFNSHFCSIIENCFYWEDIDKIIDILCSRKSNWFEIIGEI